MKIPGVYCAACQQRLPQANHTGRTPAKCPSCGSHRQPLRYCDECEQPKRVPSQIAPRAIFCRACNRAHKAAIEQRPHRVQARQRYKDEHREQARARDRARYRERREEYLAYQRAYRRKNAAYARQKSRAWYAANRERHKATMRKWQAEHPEKRKLYRSRYYAKLKADPKRYAKWLIDRRERDRFTRRVRAEQQGRPMPPVPLAEYRKRYGESLDRRTVETGPLAKIIIEILENDETLTEKNLAFRCQVAPRRIYQILHEGRVSIAAADKVCVGLGTTFSLVYPEAA
jgi:hypothetical protein